jgi:hypothetical protein
VTTGAATAATLPESDGRRPRRVDGVLLMLVGLAVLPIVVSIVQMFVRVPARWPSEADISLLEIQVRAIPGRVQYVGPYSRFGFDHPGSLLYYVLWVPYRLLGSHSIDLYIGAAAINGAAVAGIVVTVYRKLGRSWSIAATLVLLVFLHQLGPEQLRSPWNPDIALLPFLLLLVLCGVLASGANWALPVAILVASFVVESHVGYALVVGAPCAVAFIGWGIAKGRDRGTEGARSRVGVVLVGSVGLLLLLWLLPLIDQIMHSPGNLQALYDYSRGHPTNVSWRATWYAVLDQFDLRAEWYAGLHPANPFIGGPLTAAPVPIPIWAVPALAGAVIAAWRGPRALRWWFGILGVSLVAVIASVKNIEGPLFPYVSEWRAPVGMLLSVTGVAVVAVALWSTFGPYTRTAHRADDDGVNRSRGWAVAAGVGLLIAATLSVFLSTQTARQALPSAPEARTIDAATAPILLALPKTGGPVLVTGGGSFGAMGVQIGIANELDRHGIRFTLPRDTRHILPGFPFSNATPRATVTVLDTGGLQTNQLHAPTGGRLVATTATATVYLSYP